MREDDEQPQRPADEATLSPDPDASDAPVKSDDAAAAQQAGDDGADASIAADAEDSVATTSRSWLTVLLVVVAVVGAAGLGSLAVLVLTSGDKGVSSTEVWATTNTPKKGTPYLDALVVDATQSSFRLQTRDKKTHKLYLRKPDAPYLQIEHAQSHAALGQPVRVYYRTVDDKRYAIWLEDAPVIF